jgi:hypothetical protein
MKEQRAATSAVPAPTSSVPCPGRSTLPDRLDGRPHPRADAVSKGHPLTEQALAMRRSGVGLPRIAAMMD